MNDDIIIGAKGHRIVIPKKHASEFADLVIAVRNNPKDNINAFMAFIRDQVSSAVEDDIYEDVYDRLVKDNKDITEILRRTGNIAKGAGASILSMCSKFYLPLPIGPDWTDRFYKVLQLNTWLIYVISEMHSSNSELQAAIRKCASIKNDPVYRWVFASTNKMIEQNNQQSQDAQQNQNSQNKQFNSFTSDEILNLDSRDYSIVAQSINQWNWAYTPIPGERPKTLLQLLGSNTFNALKGDISSTFTSFAADAVNGVMGIGSKFVNINKDVDRMGKEVSVLRKIASDLGVEYPGKTGLPEVPNKLNRILRKDFIKRESMWLYTLIDVGLTFDMVIDCYEEVKESLAERDVVFATRKQAYEEEHREEIDAKKAEEEEIARESDEEIKQVEEEGLDPMEEFEKDQQASAEEYSKPEWQKEDTTKESEAENYQNEVNSPNEESEIDIVSSTGATELTHLNRMTQQAVNYDDNDTDRSNDHQIDGNVSNTTESEQIKSNAQEDSVPPPQSEYTHDKAINMLSEVINKVSSMDKKGCISNIFLCFNEVRRSVGFRYNISEEDVKNICEVSSNVVSSSNLDTIDFKDIFKSNEQIKAFRKYSGKDFDKFIGSTFKDNSQSDEIKVGSALSRMMGVVENNSNQSSANEQSTEQQIIGDLRIHYTNVQSCVNFINANGGKIEIPKFTRASWEIHFTQVQPKLSEMLKDLQGRGVTIPNQYKQFM